MEVETVKAFRLLVAFLAGVIYASAAWVLTVPDESQVWFILPVVILVGGSLYGALLVIYVLQRSEAD